MTLKKCTYRYIFSMLRNLCGGLSLKRYPALGNRVKNGVFIRLCFQPALTNISYKPFDLWKYSPGIEV